MLLLSDFAQWDAQVEKQMALLARQAQLALYFIHDPLEADLPAAGSYRISDGLSDLVIATDAADWRRRYPPGVRRPSPTAGKFLQAVPGAVFLTIATVQDPCRALRAPGLWGNTRHAGR